MNTADAVYVNVVYTFTFLPTFLAQAQYICMGQRSLEPYILNYENSQVTGSKVLATTISPKDDLIESDIRHLLKLLFHRYLTLNIIEIFIKK